MSFRDDPSRPQADQYPGESPHVRVHVPCVIEERHLARALEAYRELVVATRQEPGCLSYELLQGRDDTTRFVLVEEWESQEHLDAHTRTEHFVRLVAALEDLEKAEPAELYRQVL